MRVIKIKVGTGFSGADHESEETLPNGWDAMSEEEQEAYLGEIASEFMHSVIEASAWVEDDD